MFLRYRLTGVKGFYKIIDNVTNEEMIKKYSGTKEMAELICNRMNIAYKTGELTQIKESIKDLSKFM